MKTKKSSQLTQIKKYVNTTQNIEQFCFIAQSHFVFWDAVDEEVGGEGWKSNNGSSIHQCYPDYRDQAVDVCEGKDAQGDIVAVAWEEAAES